MKSKFIIICCLLFATLVVLYSCGKNDGSAVGPTSTFSLTGSGS